MAGRQGRSWVQFVIAAAILLIAFAVTWAAAPEDLRGPMLLAAGVVTAALYVGLFAVERARHW
jgi:hypothetical protein